MEISDKKTAADNPGSIAYYIEGAGAPMMAHGPLAKSITSALDQVYRREVDPATGIVLESQQLDHEKQLEWAQAVAAYKAEYDEVPAMLYGVDVKDANLADIIDVTRAVGRMSPVERAASVVVVENGESSTSPTVVALEAVCARNNVAFYRSFSNFLKRG